MVRPHDLLPACQAAAEFMRGIRRDLHAHPELSTREHRTAKVIARTLAEIGLEVHEGVAETGVVGLLHGGRPGPWVGVRVDTDALPVQEATGAEYASTVPGVMHACGHDAHVACGLGAARALKDQAANLPGSVKFIFQPSEELVSGAMRMIEAGVLDNPAPKAIVGFHVSPLHEVPSVVFSHGAKMAGTSCFEVRVTGRSGHAGYPHAAIDPIPIAAHMVSALQTVVSRRVDPTEPAVVSIGIIEGGTKANIVAEVVRLVGTIRFFRSDLRAMLIDRMTEIVVGIGGAMGAQADIEFDEGTPPLVVDDEVTDRATAACQEALGHEVVRRVDLRFMGGEDFAFMAERVPCTHFWLGVRSPGEAEWPSIHSPRFDIDEDCLPVGAAALAASALGLMGGAG